MKARILVYDLETSPIISYNWGIWEQNAIEVIEDWQILTVAWKWLGEKKVRVVGQDDYKGYKPGVNNDKMIVELVRDLFDEADVLIAHNGNSFDQKKARARMIVHGLTPPSPYKEIDTKREAKKLGAFTSNRLGSLAEQLDISQKGSPGGFATWKGCLAGDKKAWQKMKKYNKQDIPPLEELYLKLQPWMKTSLSLNVIEDRPDACPKCGKGPLQSRGFAITNTNKYRRYQCKSCSGWSQARTPEYKQAEERMLYK